MILRRGSAAARQSCLGSVSWILHSQCRYSASADSPLSPPQPPIPSPSSSSSSTSADIHVIGSFASASKPARATDRSNHVSAAAAATLAAVERQRAESLLSQNCANTSSNAAPVIDCSDGDGAGEPVTIVDDVALLTSAADVEAAFRSSVAARTVSNAQLRRFIDRTSPKDHALAVAALNGAKAGGLRINAQTYEALLHTLLESGQLRASMDLYNTMLHQRIAPTPNTYAMLMEMCLQRDMPAACQSLFKDLQRRGVRPSPRAYELMITSIAAEVPPKWEKAIEIFDKLSRERRSRVSVGTYNALMRVYLNMQPFDWRVVYNCYSEMRSQVPRIPLQWDSYLILREALRKGRAGYVRRSLAYIDAWMAVTELRSMNFFLGALVYLGIMLALKTILSYVVVWYYESTAVSTSDSILPL